MKLPIRLSVLDLSPVPSGSTAADALRNTLDLAKLADELGYTRYWLAEHHNTELVAISAPEVMIGHVAGVTKRIRVGSGGVMLPNHAPLKVAETFRTLEALHPNRVDLGIGRAPGTDYLTALALRRSRAALATDDFPEQLNELLAFFSGDFSGDHPFQRVMAIPEGVRTPDIWLLGSSDFSARLAGELGLGFAFAHHINPAPALAALRLYQEQFRPSPRFAAPQSLLAASVVCAETDEQANVLARSADLTLLRFTQGKFRTQLPSVSEATNYPYTSDEEEVVQMNRERLFVGSPATVREQIFSLAEQAGVTEIMVTTMTHDHKERRRSYTLLAKAFALAPG
ncbi:MAG: LLM class flavin-dependent oxidoreductase [Pyrinomonadaceae bacterium]|nr:LLM class flavin-dependent oxidoreductase [Pyrinomonadaceae bacterium]